MKFDHLEKVFHKGELREEMSFPVVVEPYKNIKGATVYLGDNRIHFLYMEMFVSDDKLN